MSGNKQEKVALKAGVWYVVSSIMVKMVSIITTPVFTRLLLTDEYGTVATFSSWYSLFLVIYGLNLSVSIGRAKIDFQDNLDEYIGAMQMLSLMVSLFISLIIVVFIGPISSFFELPQIATLFLVAYLVATPAINFWQSGYRYKYKYKQNIAIAWYIVISTVVLSLIFVLSRDENRDIARIAGLVIPSVALSLFFWIKTIQSKNISINRKYWKYGLEISLPMILHAISMNILAQSDRIVISKYCGNTSVAFYSLVRNYALLLFVVTDAINQAWQPWFHDNYHAGNKHEIRANTKLLVCFTCYMGLACVAIGPEAVLLLGGEKYSAAVKCLPPMVMGVVCQCIYTHYINIELHLKQTKYASQGTLIAAALNIVLNIVFVPLIGYEAAAYTTFASYLVLLILHCIITHRKLNVSVYDDRFMFCAMIISSIVAFGISCFYNNIAIRFGIIIIGFSSFLFVFRGFISSHIKKFIHRR